MSGEGPGSRMAPGWYVTNLGGMVAYGAIASSPAACGAIERRTGGRVRPGMLRAGFAIAVALHVGEAVATAVVARRRGLRARTATALTLRTLAVGFPSLRAVSV